MKRIILVGLTLLGIAAFPYETFRHHKGIDSFFCGLDCGLCSRCLRAYNQHITFYFLPRAILSHFFSSVFVLSLCLRALNTSSLQESLLHESVHIVPIFEEIFLAGGRVLIVELDGGYYNFFLKVPTLL